MTERVERGEGGGELGGGGSLQVRVAVKELG